MPSVCMDGCVVRLYLNTWIDFKQIQYLGKVGELCARKVKLIFQRMYNSYSGININDYSSFIPVP
jgi:hypothetical protein